MCLFMYVGMYLLWYVTWGYVYASVYNVENVHSSETKRLYVWYACWVLEMHIKDR